MKVIKHHLSAVAASLLLVATPVGICAQVQDNNPPPAQAQGRPRHTPEQRAEYLTERMSRNLNLTADQKAKIAEINRKYAVEREALRKQRETGGKPGQQLQQSFEEQDKAILAVLTPEQATKYNTRKEEFRQERMERMERRLENRPPYKGSR